jgi:hypothetical protein
VVTWQAKTVVHVLLRTSAENSSRTLVGLRLLSPAPPRVQLTIELYPTIPVQLSSIYPGCRSVQDTHTHRLKHALPSLMNLVTIQLTNLNPLMY